MKPSRPRILIHTSRHVARTSADSLSPARLPVPTDWDLSDAGPDLILESMAGMDIRLKGGRHTVRLNPEFPVRVEVAGGCTARASIRTASADDGHATLESVAASFESPLLIRNVFGIIRGYRGLFDNREVTAFVDRLVSLTARFTGDLESTLQGAGSGVRLLRKVLDTASERVPEVADFAKKNIDRAGSVLASMLGEPVALEINRIVLHPKVDRLRPDAEPVLALSISGSLVLAAGGRKATFRDIEVPSVLAPRPGTDLNAFVKGKGPSAVGLRPDALVFKTLVSDLAAVVESISGRVDAEVVVPTIEASWRSPDRTDSSLSFWTAQPAVSLSAHFDAVPDGESLNTVVRDLTIKSAGSRRTFVCGVSLSTIFRMDGDRIELAHVSGTLSQTNRGSLPVLLFRVSGDNPFVKAGNALTVQIDDLRSSGTFGFSFDAGGNPEFSLPDGSAGLNGAFSLPDQQFGQLSGGVMSGHVDRGRLECTLKSGPDGTLDVAASGNFPAAFEITGHTKPVPELHIGGGPLGFRAEGAAKFDLGAGISLGGGEMSVKPRGSASVEIQRWSVESIDRCIASAAPLTARVSVREGTVSRGHEGDFTVDLAWASASGEVIVGESGESRRRKLPRIFTQGTQTVHMSPSGRLHLDAGGRSFIRPEILNAMMYPGTQTGALLDLLNDDSFVDESLTSAAELVDLFNSELGARLFAARDLVLQIRGHMKDLGVRMPGDIFDESIVARLLSRMLAGDDSVADRTLALVRSINRGPGLDTNAAKLLILGCRPDLKADYEINWMLELVKAATSPIGRFEAPVRVALPPWSEDPAVAARLRDIPSARTIYDWVSSGGISSERLARILEFAPMMYIEQLSWIASKLEATCHQDACAELRFMISAKRAIARACGSDDLINLYLIPRSSVLAGFIGDLTGPIPGVDREDVPESILGPKDVADVLEVNLAAPFQGVQHQLNNRMVLELLRRRDGDFLIAVMSELSHDVVLNLAINLMAFFRQDQGWMKEPVDTEALFEEKTGMAVPRFDDFTAGGLRSRESYFAALLALAAAVIERGMPYRAIRMKLREAVPRKRIARAVESFATLEAAARDAIHSADAIAEGKGVNPDTIVMLSDAYQAAFDRCAALLAAEPRAFQADWFKDFWQRSEQAVRVASCVRNHRDNDEHVRAWLAQFDPTGTGRRLLKGARGFDDTQSLVDAFIETLWYAREDREAIRRDPLARLLMEVPSGEYDFTIVSGMGVITDGSHGLEMEAAFRRLARNRGIGLMRSPTGMFRDLEFNASAIINTVSQVSGPWGYLGYSQGGANGLRAEHMLATGTPRAREAASRLVSRNLVFSAANGSVHASSGTAVGARVLVEAEKYLKPYQSLYSREFARFMQKGTRGLLDSRQATSMISGAWSLTIERGMDLHRNGIFSETAPTSTVRGAVTPDRLPDGLQFVYSMHKRLMPGADCDSQVATVDEVGHSTRVTNARTDVLDRCDIGSRPIHTHHWGPVYDEAVQLMTADDKRLCKYDNPADVYVFPWIDTCIRFGLIRRRR